MPQIGLAPGARFGGGGHVRRLKRLEADSLKQELSVTAASMNEDEAAGALYAGVYRYAGARVEGMLASKKKLAHYTTAANALNIISGQTVWMRNAALMNDFSEIGYGKNFLAQAMPVWGNTLTEALEPYHPGLAAEILTQLDRVDHAARNQTYLTSLGEHDENDDLGKLSMWRAYGGPVAGVALVFQLEPAEDDNNADFDAFLLPVLYGPEQFAGAFKGIFDYLKASAEVLAAVPRGRAQRVLFNIFHDLMLTTKHPGFKEEQEWRLLHSPYEFPSEIILPKVTVINDVPQVVHTLELKDHEGANTPKLSLDRLVHRVIIGPCQHPEQLAHALVVALDRAGVQNPRERVRASDIPLRQRA